MFLAEVLARFKLAPSHEIWFFWREYWSPKNAENFDVQKVGTDIFNLKKNKSFAKLCWICDTLCHIVSEKIIANLFQNKSTFMNLVISLNTKFLKIFRNIWWYLFYNYVYGVLHCSIFVINYFWALFPKFKSKLNFDV